MRRGSFGHKAIPQCPAGKSGEMRRERMPSSTWQEASVEMGALIVERRKAKAKGLRGSDSAGAEGGRETGVRSPKLCRRRQVLRRARGRGFAWGPKLHEQRWRPAERRGAAERSTGNGGMRTVPAETTWVWPWTRTREALSLVPSAVSDSADWREPKFMYDGQCREGGFRFNEVTATLVEDDEKPRRLRVKFMFQKENPEIRNIRTREAWPANGVTSPPWFNTVKTEQSSIRFLAGLWSVVGDTAGHTTGSSPNGCNHHGPGRAHPGQRLWRSWTFRSRRANSWCCPMGPDGFSSRRRWGSCALEKSTTNVKKICCAGAFDHLMSERRIVTAFSRTFWST